LGASKSLKNKEVAQKLNQQADKYLNLSLATASRKIVYFISWLFGLTFAPIFIKRKLNKSKENKQK
jgi:hypothetical protein